MQEVTLLAVALLHSSIVTQLPGGCGPPRLRRGCQQLLTTPASSSPPPLLPTCFCCFRTDHCACFTVTPLQALALRWVTSTAFSLFTFWLCCFLQIAAFHLVNKQVTYSPFDAFLFLLKLQHCGLGFFALQHTCLSSGVLPLLAMQALADFIHSHNDASRFYLGVVPA